MEFSEDRPDIGEAEGEAELRSRSGECGCSGESGAALLAVVVVVTVARRDRFGAAETVPGTTTVGGAMVGRHPFCAVMSDAVPCSSGMSPVRLQLNLFGPCGTSSAAAKKEPELVGWRVRVCGCGRCWWGEVEDGTWKVTPSAWTGRVGLAARVVVVEDTGGMEGKARGIDEGVVCRLAPWPPLRPPSAAAATKFCGGTRSREGGVGGGQK